MLIRSIEELSLNSWPALNTALYDGWVLRFAEGYTRRANSINPLYPSTLDPIEKIRVCEEIYAARGQDTVFKLTPACEPANLDDLLARQGYVFSALTSVQTLLLADVDLPVSEAIGLEKELSDRWLETFCALSGIDSRHRLTITQMLRSIVPAHVFATLWHSDEPVAVGLAVREREYIGLFDVVTASHVRNRGFGTALVSQLLRWGKTDGASQAYLQVMCNNAPALHLYAKLGFREIYQYWYRVKTGE